MSHLLYFGKIKHGDPVAFCNQRFVSVKAKPSHKFATTLVFQVANATILVAISIPVLPVKAVLLRTPANTCWGSGDIL